MSVVIVILGILAGLAAIIFIPRLMVRRAASTVIRVLRTRDAVSVEKAEFADDLGLAPRSFLQRLGRTRDYKPAALKILIDSKVVVVTSDGKIYLDESSLAQTVFAKER